MSAAELTLLNMWPECGKRVIRKLSNDRSRASHGPYHGLELTIHGINCIGKKTYNRSYILMVCVVRQLSSYQANATSKKHISFRNVQNFVDNNILKFMTNAEEWKNTVMVLSFNVRCHQTQCNSNKTSRIHITANYSVIKYDTNVWFYLGVVSVAYKPDYRTDLFKTLYTPCNIVF